MKITESNKESLLCKMRETRISVPFEFEGVWYVAMPTYASKPCDVCAFRGNVNKKNAQCHVITGCMPHKRHDKNGVVFRKTIKKQ